MDIFVSLDMKGKLLFKVSYCYVSKEVRMNKKRNVSRAESGEVRREFINENGKGHRLAADA